MSGMRENLPQAVFDPSNKSRGLHRLKMAFKNSLRAFAWLSRNEAAFRQEIFLCLAAIVVLIFWQIPLLHKGVLFSSVLFVMFAEVINTAIEAIIDRVGHEIHPLSGLAKDLGSAGVFIAMGIAAVMWLAVLFTYLAR